MAVQQARQANGQVDGLRRSSDIAEQLRNRQAENGSRQSGFMGVNEERLATFLGLFGIGLGLAEVAAPESVARLIGVENDNDTQTILRAMGVREIISGIGVLAQPRPTGWLWARVGGDAMDLALLTTALNSSRSQQDKVMTALAAVVGVTVLDVLCAQQLSQPPHIMTPRELESRGMQVKRAITINRPAEELYTFWHNFENLPRFMNHLESVHVTGERRSHWKAKAPAGSSVEWDAVMTEDQPNELIAWQSLPGADVDNTGSVRFKPAPGGRGTEVLVEMHYIPPAGFIGATVAKLFGEAPEQQVKADLYAFKQVIETGEVTKSDASIHSRPHAAQPSESKGNE